MRGIVTKWIEDKGYGFLRPEDSGPDLFVHRSALLMPEPRTLVADQEVTFELGRDRQGRPQAEQVVPVAKLSAHETPYREDAAR